jgi:hypothetical protein
MKPEPSGCATGLNYRPVTARPPVLRTTSSGGDARVPVVVLPRDRASSGSGGLLAYGYSALPVEAGAAVYRTISTRHERHRRGPTALRAVHRVGDARAGRGVVTFGGLPQAAGGSARSASSRLVDQPLLRKEALLPFRPDEILPAFAALQGHVTRNHLSPTSFPGESPRRSAMPAFRNVSPRSVHGQHGV